MKVNEFFGTKRGVDNDIDRTKTIGGKFEICPACPSHLRVICINRASVTFTSPYGEFMATTKVANKILVAPDTTTLFMQERELQMLQGNDEYVTISKAKWLALPSIFA